MASLLVAGIVFINMQTNSIAANDCNCENCKQGTISVSTNADKEISPDTLEISIAIKTKDNKTLQKAVAENKRISDDVYAALKAMINAQNGDYVKTANYSARPVYIYNSNNKKVLDKYEVSNNIIVHTKNIEQAGAIIDKATSLGATDVNDLNFSVSKYENYCNELLATASQKAKTRADIVTKASGSLITGVKRLSISCSENTPNRVQYRYMAKNALGANMAADSAAVEEVATPIQSGVIKVYASVNAEYYVK